MTGRTKIVATIGPASDSVEVLGRLIEEGADVMRLNLSHGTLDEHLEVLARIRSVAAGLARPVAVLADLPGPKIRAGTFPDGGVLLGTGATVQLVSGNGPSDDRRIEVDYPTLLEDLAVGREGAARRRRDRHAGRRGHRRVRHRPGRDRG